MIDLTTTRRDRAASQDQAVGARCARRYRAVSGVVGGIGRLDPAVAKGLNMLGQETAKMPFLGAVVSVRGSVVDIRFDEHLPPIYSVLRAGDKGQIVIEVQAQLDARHVRGIALTPTQGLARGMSVEDTGAPLMAPVGHDILSRMFDVFGNAIDRAAALPTSNGVRCIERPTPVASLHQV